LALLTYSPLNSANLNYSSEVTLMSCQSGNALTKVAG
jgi:hypothetical protein